MSLCTLLDGQSTATWRDQRLYVTGARQGRAILICECLQPADVAVSPVETSSLALALRGMQQW